MPRLATVLVDAILNFIICRWILDCNAVVLAFFNVYLICKFVW